MKVIAWLEFERIYYDVTVLYGSHDARETLFSHLFGNSTMCDKLRTFPVQSNCNLGTISSLVISVILIRLPLDKNIFHGPEQLNYISVYLSNYLYLCLGLFISVYQPITVCIYPSIYLSVGLGICLDLFISN